jgi:hypothetical protein
LSLAGDTDGRILCGGNGAGNKLCQMSSPTDMAVGPSDIPGAMGLYVCDCHNSRVLRSEKRGWKYESIEHFPIHGLKELRDDKTVVIRFGSRRSRQVRYPGKRAGFKLRGQRRLFGVSRWIPGIHVSSCWGPHTGIRPQVFVLSRVMIFITRKHFQKNNHRKTKKQDWLLYQITLYVPLTVNMG